MTKKGEEEGTMGDFQHVKAEIDRLCAQSKVAVSTGRYEEVFSLFFFFFYIF